MMTPLFAQIENVPAATIKDFILMIAGAGVTAYYVKELFFGTKGGQISPQPLIVALEKEFITRKDFTAHISKFEGHVVKCDDKHAKIEMRIQEVEKNTSSIMEKYLEAVRRDVVVVSDQVGGLSRHVTAVQAINTLQTKQLERIEQTQADMPGKIVADLLNAKRLTGTI